MLLLMKLTRNIVDEGKEEQAGTPNKNSSRNTRSYFFLILDIIIEKKLICDKRLKWKKGKRMYQTLYRQTNDGSRLIS